MEDDQIVDLYWARSERAVAETAHKYGRYCYSIAYNILLNAEDAAQFASTDCPFRMSGVGSSVEAVWVLG